MSTPRGGSSKKRGHQHHPRNEGSRRRLVLESLPLEGKLSQYSLNNVVTEQSRSTITNENDSVIITSASNIVNTNKCDNEVIDLTTCDEEVGDSSPEKDAACFRNKRSNVVTAVTQEKVRNTRDKCSDSNLNVSIQDKDDKTTKNEINKKLRRPKKSKSNKSVEIKKDMTLIKRPEVEGSSQSDQELDVEENMFDPETEELSKLRCTSEMTEVVAEREKRRRRCADYPGLAFASSIFSSDTLMKFSIIRNELHNIMNTQLKRAESEVAALNRRIQLLEEDLERSEERLATATAKLAEASAAADESERIRKALENRTNMEDDRVAVLEQQLAQAKLIAEEADKKYEEVARKLVMMEQDLERAEERAEQSDSKIVELEEELRVVGNNLKSLEVSEEKATRKEDEYSVTLKQMEQQLREAEARAEFAERSVQKLQKEVDRLEDDLLLEKDKNKMLADEMEATLHDIQNM